MCIYIYGIEQGYDIDEEKKQKKEIEAYTMDGSVDRHGHPAVRGRSGSWLAGVLILGTYEHINIPFNVPLPS